MYNPPCLINSRLGWPSSSISEDTIINHELYFYFYLSQALAYFEWSIKNPGKFLTKNEIVGTIEWDHIDCTTAVFDGPPAEMGYYADTAGTQTGRFYIEPNEELPYGNKI